MKYRVILKVGYRAAYFDFDNAADAIAFSESAVSKNVPTGDNDDTVRVLIRIAESFGDDDE